jgi:hypothetical protein
VRPFDTRRRVGAPKIRNSNATLTEELATIRLGAEGDGTKPGRIPPCCLPITEDRVDMKEEQMAATRVAKPIIKIYLLPAWDEGQFKACFNGLVRAARSVPALQVNSGSDLIVLFSQDAMVYGLGAEIFIEVNVPRDLIVDNEVENETADAIHAVMQGLLPDAYVQCKVNPFSTDRGYHATGMRYP